MSLTVADRELTIVVGLVWMTVEVQDVLLSR